MKLVQIRSRWLWFTVVGLALSFSQVNAEMIYQSAARRISGSGSQLNEILETSASLGTYSDDLLNSGYMREDGNIVGSVTASSSQTSTLTSNQIRGLGRGSGFGSGPADGLGSSYMDVAFMIEESTRFTLAGQLRLAPHGGELGLNGSSAYVRLTGPDGVVAMEVLMDEENQPDNLGIVDFTGGDELSRVLPAGAYRLEAFSEGHGSSGLTRCADFDFTLSVLEAAAVDVGNPIIPEPNALSMAGLGSLIGFCFRRRRR